MIPAGGLNPELKKVIISTGNILSLNNTLGAKSNEELLDGLKLTLQCREAADHVVLENLEGTIMRATQELNAKITENTRPEISVGVKLFITQNCDEYIKRAVKSVLEILKVDYVDNVVLAYRPQPASTSPAGDCGAAALPATSDEKEKQQTLVELKKLWTTLEQCALETKVCQLGVSDLDIDALSQLYDAARVPPTIAQINLSSCCVVPPPLQDFCTKHDIRLLTHSDPDTLLPRDQVIIPDYNIDWTLRYQVHVRCRGVLAAKGYIVGATKTQQS